MLEPSQQPGFRNYWKADMYPELPDEMIDTVVEQAEKPPVSPQTAVLLQPLGGQVHRVDDEASAMGWRKAKWAIHVLGMWEDPADDEAQIAWVRNVASSVEPWAQAGTYLNYLMDEGEGRVRASFGPKYDRMVELKNKYDPANLFSLNQNIKPTT
jgi:hypothetical protein